MTADPAAVEMLLTEIQDDLAADIVGLYEFIWTLNTMRPDLDRESKIDVADEVLRRLMSEGRYQLVWQVWAKSDLTEPAGDIWPSRSDWNDPTDDPYLSIDWAGSAAGR